MNIEELTKSQLLLLTVLVTFVTSIATGILTVSLLDQAPPVVTQTVNRIVERTVKTVAPSLPATVVKTVASAPPPSSEDLVTSALAAQDARTVLLYQTGQSTSTPALAVGTYLPAARVVVTMMDPALPGEAMIEFPNGETFSAVRARENREFALFHFSDKEKLPSAPNPDLVPLSNLKLGETVLAIRGDGSATTGIVSQITARGIYTTLPAVGAGVGAVDLSGNLIGIATGNTRGLFLSADAIKSFLTATSTITHSSSSSTTTPSGYAKK